MPLNLLPLDEIAVINKEEIQEKLDVSKKSIKNNDHPTLCIQKNGYKDLGEMGCTIVATARNIHQVFECKSCPHQGNRNCVSLKLGDFM